MATIFLTGAALSARIRKVMKGNKPRMCVAFLGPEWVTELFDGSTPSELRVICDLKMGMTPKSALIAGGAPDNKALRYLQDTEMHAKVYLSEGGAVVCSANASSRALSATNRIEDGLWIGPETDAYAQVAEQFEARYQDGTVVDQTALEVAPLSVFAPGDKQELPAGLTLDEALRRNPQAFHGIRFICTDTNVSKHIQDEANTLIDREQRAEGGLADTTPREHFSGWETKEGDWPAIFFSVHRRARGGFVVTKNRHYRFLDNVKGEEVFISHKLGWSAAGAAFGDVPHLASRQDCEDSLKRLFSLQGSFNNLAGTILTAEDFAQALPPSL
jgi:hypothetical protein